MSKRSSKKDPKKNEQLEAVVFNFKNFNKTLNTFFFEKKRPKNSIGKEPVIISKRRRKEGRHHYE
jgi:hypothetical protein